MNPTGRLTSYAHEGLVFDVLDEGPPDGPVVVLLHGFPQRATSWAKVAPLLHAHGYRTIAPDQRGYSRGARPVRRRDYTMDKLVKDIQGLIHGFVGHPVHLVGHDWGAAVAWATAAIDPAVISTLTAVSVPHPVAMARALRTRDQLRRSWYMGFFQLPWLPELLLGRPAVAAKFLGSAGMSREAIARFRSEIVDDGALPGSLGWYRAMPLSGGGLGGRVRVPTTHVWSDGDTALGRLGAELSASYVVGAPYQLEVLRGVSHWIPDEAPERLAEIVLERVAGPRTD